MESFKSKVSAALEQVRRVLHANKHPVFADEVHHKYEDKYRLAQFLTNATLASNLTCLSSLGVSLDQLTAMMDWAKSRSVSLRFRATERCSFVREVKREVDSDRKVVTETTVLGKFSTKVVTTITEYIWRFDLEYELQAFRGTGDAAGDVIRIMGRSATHEITTGTTTNPRKEVVVRPNVDVTISWLLTALTSQAGGVVMPNFSIDRRSEDCRTPSNNSDVQAALSFFGSLQSWCQLVHSYFSSEIYPLMSKQSLDLSAVSSRDVFVPVLPLFDSHRESRGSSTGPASVGLLESSSLSESGSSAGALVNSRAPDSVLLDLSDVNLIVAEEQRSLRDKLAALRTVFASPSLLMSSTEAALLVTLLHVADVVQYYRSGINAIEEMLRNQLVAAIGKVVTPSDFSNYMRFHNNKLFAEAYRPKPFCYAVRRSELHAPEGVLSIEEGLSDGSMPDPIFTVANGPSDGSARPMTFTLSAATRVTFGGHRYVHAWLRQRFQYAQYDPSPSRITLKAQARQFSSFIVLLGRISSADSFDPKYGMIVQNKDELSIPLDLEAIPSAKEFKDAIESLSPEQQAFAKAFRGMQLESTLFGVCVIQIKPQLEKLLKLHPDSLTKEIQLTQDLMELFIKYQIPSDLLSFQGDEEAPSAERVAAVKGYVRAMQDMIRASKERELEEKRQADIYASNMAATNISVQASGYDEDLIGMEYVHTKGIVRLEKAEEYRKGGTAHIRLSYVIFVYLTVLLINHRVI
jgi:hypothetical protein